MAKDMIGNYQVEKVTQLPEIQCEQWELTHLPTGARILHLANDDQENSFCLSFQTIPKSSDGVAHILEHTVLCGSKKYPIKDPFFCMMRRSLHTFMNAFTGADFTCYPASSQIPKDFYNLLDVYTDAVFRPIIREESFMQEGHHFEFAEADNKDTPLTYHGIVFNEMKGALVTADSRLSEAVNEALYPTTTYGVNSGGDPKDIPSLTYEGLKEFHSTYYHPSRCLFYFYGNIPLKSHLEYLEKNVFKDIKGQPPLPKLPNEKRKNKPVRSVVSYPFAKDEDPKGQSLVSFAWLTCQIDQQEELTGLLVIMTALMNNDGSPLKMALLRSGLCKQTSCSLGDENYEIPLEITLRGCEKEHADDLEKVLMDTLKTIETDGIDRELIDNVIHQIEFHRSEISGDSLPYGLSLFLRSGLLKQHGGHPEDALKVHSLCKKLREMSNDDYLKLLKRFVIDNPHMVRMTAVPDTELAAKELEEERVRLEKIKETLSEKEKQTIVKRTKDLEEFQKEQENEKLDILPKVTLDDVPNECNNFDITKETMGPIRLYHHDTFTNGIVYAKLTFPLPKLQKDDLWKVKLFTSLLTQLGSGGRNYVDTLQDIQANTGALYAGLSLNISAENYNTFSPYIFIGGKALERKADRFFALIKDVATSVDFDDLARLKEIITKQATGMRAVFNHKALQYAVKESASGFSTPSMVTNTWGGLEYYENICNLADNFDDHCEQFVNDMKRLKEMCLGLKDGDLILSCQKGSYDNLKQRNFYDLPEVCQKDFEEWNEDYVMPKVKSQGHVIASPVAFTAKSVKTPSYTHPDSPTLAVASQLLSNLTLHTKIREQGGAYGGGASNNALSGHFTFYSYRDPNIADTLKAFEESVDGVLKGDFNDTDIEEAKLEIIQDLDSPISPGSRGDLAYARMRAGKSRKVRQAYRDRVLRATKSDIIKAVKTHLADALKDGVCISFSGRELLEKENVRIKECEGAERVLAICEK